MHRRAVVHQTRAPLRVRVERRVDRTAVVHLAGELDIATAPALRARLRDLLEPRRADPVASLVVDLSELEFIDVAGVSVLLEAEQLLRPRGQVLLLDPSPVLCRVVGVLGLGDRLRLAVDSAA